ncbi:MULTISPECIES: hypothetical protein [unclassified Mesorhizobium]|uniref:hypothetical protein n=1 Tax=unclassified Mesorhizobium TaxID=325217 RepID=UPI001937AA3F|nr:hypothetical protein MesoLj131a_61670 [Mesorhizobium sp. 131-2-1]BCH04374.1 hypothetical protein MesoLj131b_63730 [Mesorhizobium sp. 131-2-5]
MTNQLRSAIAQALPFSCCRRDARFASWLAVPSLAIVFLILPALTAPAAVNIQEVKSEKGITAWLVEDHTLPIVTLHLVFDGGTTQDRSVRRDLPI